MLVFVFFNAGLFQSLSLSGNAITCLLWEVGGVTEGFLITHLSCLHYIVLLLFTFLKTDDDKSDNEIVQRRPIRISLRGSGRFKELNKISVKHESSAHFQLFFFSARSA